MPDVDARLDKVEEGLKELGERVDKGFARIDERFTQIDERFTQIDERFTQIDGRFTQIDGRFAQIDQRFVDADGRFGSLEEAVQKLRLLGEENDTQIKKIAEVQGHHGEKLQQLVDAVAPLKDLRDFVKRVADDHENRIKALEAASSTGTRHA